jgi:MOSC domain-containing protein YiiM
MPDLFTKSTDDFEIVPGRKLAAHASAVLKAPGNHFVTVPVDRLAVDFEGIEGDFHRGHTRHSGGREPWYPRGTQMRNERQLSLVAMDELAIVADRMGIEKIAPEWIGANLVVAGVPFLSMLPRGTFLFFEGGVTLKVDGQNAPCRLAGRSVAEHARMADHDAGALAFASQARRLRGLVAWVEKPGVIARDEKISVRIPEQWIYRS